MSVEQYTVENSDLNVLKKKLTFEILNQHKYLILHPQICSAKSLLKGKLAKEVLCVFMYDHVYICYIYIYMYVYVRIHAYIYMYIYTYINTCIYVCFDVFQYVKIVKFLLKVRLAKEVPFVCDDDCLYI